jgi:hypothetical protein
MENLNDINHSANEIPIDTEQIKLAQLYLSTCETLAKQAYEATAKQQQLNILAQQVTTNGIATLYSALIT